MLPYIPYFYIIQDIRNGMYYAGSKYAKDANPKTFMLEDGYTTSSNLINSIISKYDLSIFIIRKIRTFNTGDEAYEYETKFLRKINAKSNPRFYNTHNNDLLPAYGSKKFKEYMLITYGAENCMHVDKIKQKVLNTVTSAEWKETKGKAILEKRLKLVTSVEWKETIGKGAIEKRIKNTDQISKGKNISKTMNDTKWKETKGKEGHEKRVKNTNQETRGKNISNTKLSTEWKETKGKIANKKRSDTMNNIEWKETIGKEGHKKRVENVNYKNIGKKISETRNDPEWKEKNKKTCPHCLRKIPNANFTRFHGDKCKSNPFLC